MKDRCNNSKNYSFKDYGARGIKICNEWVIDFMNFYNWAMNNGYQDNLTIDRIDVNGNYEPSNCRWVTMKEQARNKSTNVLLTLNGKTKCVAEWSEIIGLDAKVIYARISRGHTDPSIILYAGDLRELRKRA